MRAGRRAACAAGLALFLLAGCGPREASMEGERAAEADYTQGQIMVIAATERNRYQNIYTSQLWQVEADPEGNTFEEVLKDQMGRFLVELATVDQMAQEQGVELTSQEEDSLKSLSQEYYAGLTQEDLDYMGVAQDEVYDLYCMYYRADKMVEEMTQGQNLEVSDAEAKVIEIQQIVLEDRETADQVLELVQAEGADFASIAGQYSVEEEVRESIGRGEADAAIEEAAFSLEQGQISPVIQGNDGRYYLIQCINPYDQEATASRKAEMALVQKDGAFRQLYDEFLAEHPVEVSGAVWDNISCVTDEDTTTTNFFELYGEYFKD